MTPQQREEILELFEFESCENNPERAKRFFKTLLEINSRLSEALGRVQKDIEDLEEDYAHEPANLAGEMSTNPEAWNPKFFLSKRNIKAKEALAFEQERLKELGL